MSQKSESEGIFAAMGRVADESIGIAAAIGAGSMTREKFDAWYEKRRAEGTGIVVSLRERATNIAEPVGTVIVRGQEMMRAAMPRVSERPRRRRRTLRRPVKRAVASVARKAKGK